MKVGAAEIVVQRIICFSCIAVLETTYKRRSGNPNLMLESPSFPQKIDKRMMRIEDGIVR